MVSAGYRSFNITGRRYLDSAVGLVFTTAGRILLDFSADLCISQLGENRSHFSLALSSSVYDISRFRNLAGSEFRSRLAGGRTGSGSPGSSAAQSPPFPRPPLDERSEHTTPAPCPASLTPPSVPHIPQMPPLIDVLRSSEGSDHQVCPRLPSPPPLVRVQEQPVCRLITEDGEGLLARW